MLSLTYSAAKGSVVLAVKTLMRELFPTFPVENVDEVL